MLADAICFGRLLDYTANPVSSSVNIKIHEVYFDDIVSRKYHKNTNISRSVVT